MSNVLVFEWKMGRLVLNREQYVAVSVIAERVILEEQLDTN